MRAARRRARAAVLASAAALAATGAAGADLTDWIEGVWHDPRLHRCGEVAIRLAVGADGERYTIYQRTYGRELAVAGGPILTVEPTGMIVVNEAMGRTQRIRYVTPDAHVLEKLDGSGGVTFVRCPSGAADPSSD